jgi:hypothetical protein
MNISDRIPSWVGIIITIVVAVGTSVGTYAARMYQTEKEIEVLQVRVKILEDAQVKTSDLLEQINERTIRIEEGMKMKADKVWSQK